MPVRHTQLFASGGWPSDPTDDFSAVSLLDQPGERTWPISSMPFMFVRTDNMGAGARATWLIFGLDFPRGSQGPVQGLCACVCKHVCSSERMHLLYLNSPDLLNVEQMRQALPHSAVAFTHQSP